MDAAHCYRCSNVVSMSVRDNREPCKNSSTNRDAVWNADWGGSREQRIRWGARWRHLANLTETTMCGSIAALHQMTLITRSLTHLFWELIHVRPCKQKRTSEE